MPASLFSHVFPHTPVLYSPRFARDYVLPGACGRFSQHRHSCQYIFSVSPSQAAEFSLTIYLPPVLPSYNAMAIDEVIKVLVPVSSDGFAKISSLLVRLLSSSLSSTFFAGL